MYLDALELEPEGFAAGTGGCAPGQDLRVRICLSCGALVHPGLCTDHRARCTARAVDIDPLPEGLGL